MQVLISKISWKVTLNGRIYFLSMFCSSEETFLLGLPSPTFSFVTYSQDSKLNILIIVYSSLDQPTSSAKAQGPNIILGPYPYSYVSCVHIFNVVQDIGPLVLDFLIILPLGLEFEILIKKGISTLCYTHNCV